MKNDFYPTLEMARSALGVHSLRIKRSIKHLLKAIQNDAGFSDPCMQHAIEIVDKPHRFHPETHYLHHKLIIAMKSQNREAAESECRSLLRSLAGWADDDIVHIASVGAAHWERDTLNRAVDSASTETGLDACAMPVAEDAFLQQSIYLRNGLKMLEQYDPAGHAELITLIQGVKLFSGKIMQGLSDTRVFGEIYVRVPRDCVDPVAYYVEHIVHETAHTYLNCLMADDPIVVNSLDDRFPSPLRKDLRPMYAVYHATFVAARMALTFKKIFEHTGEHRWVKILAEVTDETIRGIKTIENSGNLTARGEKIIKDIHELLPQIAALPAWKNFDFERITPHRCGAGVARYTDFQALLSSR